MLNAKEILKEGLIVLDNAKGKPAQVGYDLSVQSIKLTGGSMGMVLVDKTIVGELQDIGEANVNGRDGWVLEPGTYDVTMNEGCDIAANRTAMVISFAKSAVRIVGYLFIPFNISVAVTLLVVSEAIGIIEELV